MVLPNGQVVGPDGWNDYVDGTYDASLATHYAKSAAELESNALQNTFTASQGTLYALTPDTENTLKTESEPQQSASIQTIAFT
jgi:hypothetical protein